MELEEKIKAILNTYGCLKEGGKLWCEVIDAQRNEDLINELLSLHGVMYDFISEIKLNLQDLTKDRDYWLNQKQYEKAISILTCVEQIKQVVKKYDNKIY